MPALEQNEYVNIFCHFNFYGRNLEMHRCMYETLTALEKNRNINSS